MAENSKTCPRCKCPETELQALLRRFAEDREVREQNKAAIQLASDQSAWRDTVGEEGR